MLDSLKSKVKKNIKSTLYKNDTYIEYKWPLLKRVIFFGNQNITLSIVFITVFVGCISSLLATYQIFLEDLFGIRIKDLAPVVSLINNAAAIQAGILGMVFPLVISFIGFLIKDRSENEALWKIYKSESAFLISGFSGLAFLLAYTSTTLSSSFLPSPILTTICLALSFWFIINVVLVAYFLWQTQRFLVPEQRMKIVVSNAINSVIKYELQARLSKVISSHPTHNEINALVGFKDSIKVGTDLYNRKELPETIDSKFDKGHMLVDIWYAPLNWFLKQYSKKQSIQGDEKVQVLLPTTSDHIEKRHFTILRTSGTALSKLEKAIVKLCFRFKQPNQHDNLSMGELTRVLFGQVDKALSDSDLRAYEHAVKQLSEFQKSIESTLYFYDEKNACHDNWLLLSDGSFFGSTFIDSFLKQAFDTADIASSLVYTHPKYFDTWCYFYLKAYSNKDIQRPNKLVQKYLQAHYMTWGRLMNSIAKNENNSKNSFRNLDICIKRFIGCWEYWYDLFDRNNTHKDEGVSKEQFELIEKHLQHTSCMIVMAAQYRNWDAMRWAADVLVSAYDRLRVFRRKHNEHFWHYKVMTPSLIYDADVNNFIKGAFKGQDVNAIGASDITFRNLWLDIRITVAGYLINTGCTESKSIYSEVIMSLLDETTIESRSTFDRKIMPVSSVKDLLDSYLRVNGGWNNKYLNQNIVSATLQRLDQIEQPEWISGRFYSSVGTVEDQMIPITYKVIGIGLCKSNFELSTDWYEFISSKALTVQERKNTSEKLKKLTSITDELKAKVEQLYAITSDEVEARVAIFIRSITDICETLESDISSEIINAPIDKQKLNLLSEYASLTVTNTDRLPFPLDLFQRVERSEVSKFEGEVQLFRILDYNKSEIAEGVDIQRVSNEKDWMSDMTEQRFVASVIRQIILNTKWQEQVYDNVSTLLISALKDAVKMEHQAYRPLLLVGSWDIYTILEDLKWNRSNASDQVPFKISTAKHQPEHYICHINELPVYKLPNTDVKECFLVNHELFDHLELVQFENGLPVKASYEDPKKIKSSLSLNFGIKAHLTGLNCFRYIFDGK